MTRVVIDWIGGNCPVQAEGTIDGALFYFRARGSSWSIEIGDTLPFHWEYREDYGTWPDAGYMEEDEARAFITKGAGLYAEAKTQKGAHS
jgi:hypothetical protein